jgi:hypothetical protein
MSEQFSLCNIAVLLSICNSEKFILDYSFPRLHVKRSVVH